MTAEKSSKLANQLFQGEFLDMRKLQNETPNLSINPALMPVDC